MSLVVLPQSRLLIRSGSISSERAVVYSAVSRAATSW